VYIEWGRTKRRHPGEVGETICSATVEAYRKKFLREPRLSVPAESYFSQQLGPAAEFLERFSEEESFERILIILDDCEYMQSLTFFQGESGQQFFQSLKTIANARNVVLFLIGSEQFRTIFDRYMSSIINIGDVVEITYITDPKGQRELIVSPAEGVLHFDDEAYSDIVMLSAGNPWFSNKLCNELYDEMVKREDGYVTRAELAEVVGRIANERGLRGNFAHLWEESVGGSEDGRRAAVVAAAAMIAIARHDSSPLEFTEETAVLRGTHQYLSNDQEVMQTLRALRQSGVLLAAEDTNATKYRIRVGLFHQWLRGVGRAELEGEFQELVSMAKVDATLRVSESEIMEIADRGWRRTDGRALSSIEIRAWLDNFDSHRKQRYAYALLGALQYFDRLRIRSALSTLFDKVKSDMRAVRFNSRGMPINIFATYADEGGKSGGVLLRSLNQALGGLVRSGAPSRLDAFLKEATAADELRAIVVVNDFIGSGQSARREIERLVAQCRRVASSPDSLRYYYIAVAGFLSVIEHLIEQLADTEKILVDEPLLESDRAFAEASQLFNVGEKIECRRMCEEIGRQLVGDVNKLGYSGSQALVAFEHGIPNNTLPIFWSSGRYDGREWTPLFKRETFVAAR
jgi:hypothetical protein